jgi:hypothetical protein
MPLRNHEHLFEIVTTMSSDFAPWGERMPISGGCIQPDCSDGCRFFNRLVGSAGLHWGVCLSQQSPRSGILTYQGFGCAQFERRHEDDYDMQENETSSGGTDGR